MEKLENVKKISTTFFIFSYISLSFPVIACNSCHCVKQNAKQNQNAAHKSVPLGTRGPIDTTHPTPHPHPPPHPCYATARVWASRPLWLRTDNLKWELTSQQQLGKLVKFCIIIISEYFVFVHYFIIYGQTMKKPFFFASQLICNANWEHFRCHLSDTILMASLISGSFLRIFVGGGGGNLQRGPFC